MKVDSREKIRRRAEVLAATNKGVKGRERSLLALMGEYGLSDESAFSYLRLAKKKVDDAQDSEGR
jgi:hypothetical protein